MKKLLLTSNSRFLSSTPVQPVYDSKALLGKRAASDMCVLVSSPAFYITHFMLLSWLCFQAVLPPLCAFPIKNSTFDLNLIIML